MIITAWYMGRKVLLGVEPGMLVFDGGNWVSPSVARFVALKYKTQAQASLPQEYPIEYAQQHVELRWTNYWLCQVVSVADGNDMPADVDEVVDDNNGKCICGVTCFGTNYQDVVVYAIK